MDTIVETFEHAGLTVEIHSDEGGEHADPRQYDNLGIMLCAHGRYELGDEQIGNVDLEVTCSQCNGQGYFSDWRRVFAVRTYGWEPVLSVSGNHVDLYIHIPPEDYYNSESEDEAIDRALDNYGMKRDPNVPRYVLYTYICPKCEGEGRVAATLDEWLRKERGAIGPILRLGLIDHSGISMYVGGGPHWSDSAGWDSGTVGVIFTTEERLRALGYESRDELSDDKIEEYLTDEVKLYDMYLRGEVYGYVIDKLAGDKEIADVYPGFDADHVPGRDSCWGFLGMEDVTEQAKEAAEGIAKDLCKFIRKESNECRWAARQGIVTEAS